MTILLTTIEETFYHISHLLPMRTDYYRPTHLEFDMVLIFHFT